MTKSKLFNIAHKHTKRILKTGDNYMATFSTVLKLVYAKYGGKTVGRIKEWNKNGKRFYINFKEMSRWGVEIEVDAGYISYDKNGYDFSNVKEEFRSRIFNNLEAEAVLFEDGFFSVCEGNIRF